MPSYKKLVLLLLFKIKFYFEVPATLVQKVDMVSIIEIIVIIIITIIIIIIIIIPHKMSPFWGNLNDLLIFPQTILACPLHYSSLFCLKLVAHTLLSKQQFLFLTAVFYFVGNSEMV